jgi:RNA polymerase sigma-70 factor (sigma-E family)
VQVAVSVRAGEVSVLFEEYVVARGPALLRLAYVLTTDSHAAEDLVQSALADAYRHWRRVERADHPDAYVRRVLVNTHLSRQRRRSVHELTGSVRDIATDPVGAGVPDPADAVVDRDAARRTLDALPPRARTVLVLRYYADLDDDAIADLLGLATSSVRSTASRALATLREHVRPPYAAEETR